MNFHKLFSTLAIGCALLPAFGQSSKEETLADLNRTGAVYYAYPFVLGRMLGPSYEVGNFGHSGTTLLKHGP